VVESVLWNVPVGGWTNWTLGNHDEIRLATRLGERSKGIAALLLLTLRGTPFLYYGDELGMREETIVAHARRDPWGHAVDYLSRDGARTPMRWTNRPNAGFSATSAVDPWLPVGDDVDRINVESELADPGSTLNLYRRLLAVRRDSTALRRGSYLTHPASTNEVLVFRRESDDETMTVALNFGEAESTVPVGAGSVVFSTLDPDRSDRVREGAHLAPFEGVIVSHG
jgi:alpha-glucosidase